MRSDHAPFRLNHDQGRNENAPAGTGANCNWITVARGAELRASCIPLVKPSQDRIKGGCAYA